MADVKPWDEVRDERLLGAMRHWREARHKYTQSEVAQAIGLHRSTYSQMENGRSAMTHRYLKQLADFYGLSSEEEFLAQGGATTGRSVPAPGGDAIPDATRGWVLYRLADLAMRGVSDAEVAGARTLLTCPHLMGYLQELDDEARHAALQAQLDGVILPVLRHRGYAV